MEVRRRHGDGLNRSFHFPSHYLVLDADTPDLPCPEPLPEAVSAGVFGLSSDGALWPDEEQIRSLMSEQARELSAYLAEIDWLDACREYGWNPHTGRPPRKAEAAGALHDKLSTQLGRAREAYENCLAAYEEGFGEDAARELDRYVREAVASRVTPDVQRQCRLF